jgi:hypothetical protein
MILLGKILVLFTGLQFEGGGYAGRRYDDD